MLCADSILTSSAEMAGLKSLGLWLGRLTVLLLAAAGKEAGSSAVVPPVLGLRELLLDGYERGWLAVVLPFVCKRVCVLLLHAPVLFCIPVAARFASSALGSCPAMAEPPLRRDPTPPRPPPSSASG